MYSYQTEIGLDKAKQIRFAYSNLLNLLYKGLKDIQTGEQIFHWLWNDSLRHFDKLKSYHRKRPDDHRAGTNEAQCICKDRYVLLVKTAMDRI